MGQRYETVISQMNQAGREGTPFLFALDYEQHEGVFIENPLAQREVLFSVGDYSNIEGAAQGTNECIAQLEKRPMPITEYARRFEIIQRGMREGRSALANLTVATPIEVRLRLRDIAQQARAAYKLYLPDERFVCFSPERFVKIDRNGEVTTCPMKGTITEDAPGAPESILNDYKETSEHCAVVDLLRQDLSRVAEEVRVRRFRYFTEIITGEKRIYQVSSEIGGLLPGAWQGRIGTTIGSMLPAGSILGAPREATRELIAEAEQGTARGYYCGVFGYYDGSSVDSAVLIRCIQEDATGQRYYHSGGGITINSKMEQEYREVIAKVYLPLQ